METLEPAMKIFDAVMALVFTITGIIYWNIGVWKENEMKKIYGLVMVICAYIVFRH